MRKALSSGARSQNPSRRAFLLGTAAGLIAARARAADTSRPVEMTAARSADELTVRLGTRDLLTYRLKKPAGSPLAVESGCYYHPLLTPGGTVVTEVAPDDHTHHRGLFLAWVEMKGAKDADFWGWGERAPTRNRRIQNRLVEPAPPEMGSLRFRVVNDWMAEGRRLLTEDQRVIVTRQEGANVLHLAVQLSVEAEVTLARCAFGGLALRSPKAGKLVAIGEGGEVRRPAPKHTDPASDWPDAPWYGLHLKRPDGKEATVAVVGRAANPPTAWHVVSAIGLINPCITAPAAVRLVPGKPLVLRYSVMAFDGPPNLPAIQRAAASWYGTATAR